MARDLSITVGSRRLQSPLVVAYLDREGSMPPASWGARQTFAALPERPGNWRRYGPAEARGAS